MHGIKTLQKLTYDRIFQRTKCQEKMSHDSNEKNMTAAIQELKKYLYSYT